MFTDKIEAKDIDKMDPEYRELLAHVLTIQADCEIGGPHLYVEKMLPAAPTKMDQLIVARTAAEEIDHIIQHGFFGRVRARSILSAVITGKPRILIIFYRLILNSKLSHQFPST